jgi:hypothetical protein
MLVNNYEQCFNIHVKNPLFLSQKFAKITNGKIIINISILFLYIVKNIS